MDYATFKATWNKFDGWNRCQAIIFDNDMRWLMNECNYHKVYENIDDGNGNIIKRYIPNDPRGFYKVDENGEYILDENGQMIRDYKDLHDYIFFHDDIESLSRKLYFTGSTQEEILEGTPLYTIEVRHVEMVQLLCFCDENNPEARPLYPIHG